jgi:HSP20 family molecular chaperone IbpA
MRKPKTGTVVIAVLSVALLGGLAAQAYILYELNQRVRATLGAALGGLSALSLESGDLALLDENLLAGGAGGEALGEDTRQLLDDLLSQPMDGSGSVSDEDLAAAQDLLRSLLGDDAGGLDLRGLEGLNGLDGLGGLEGFGTPGAPAPDPPPAMPERRPMGGALPEVTPTADLLDQPTQYYMVVNVPGVNEDTVHVALDGQRLTVDAVAMSTLPPPEEATMLMRERRTGRFHREVTLPRAVDPGSLRWHEANGTLHITVEKAGPAVESQPGSVEQRYTDV